MSQPAVVADEGDVQQPYTTGERNRRFSLLASINKKTRASLGLPDQPGSGYC